VIHELKTWPLAFGGVVAGVKTHEIRVADRPYTAGDMLHLREWSPSESDDGRGVYTGRECYVEVTYLSAAGTWGLPCDLCVMSVRLVNS
jgi:hypothetical protein